MSSTRTPWPILTLAGITAAVLIGYAHSCALKFNEYLGCDQELGQRTDTPNVDPLGGDWQ